MGMTHDMECSHILKAWHEVPHPRYPARTHLVALPLRCGRLHGHDGDHVQSGRRWR
jgi:hypothetical protein